MFTSTLRGRKVFAAIAKINAQKLKVSSSKIIEMSTAKMNLRPSRQYGLPPEEVERPSLSNERFKIIFNTKRI